jgi:hypothetical protein
MNFGCSLCNYTTSLKHNANLHINKKNKCGEGVSVITELKIDISCEFCKKSFATKRNLGKHLGICKVKKINLEQENKVLKEKLAIAEALNNKPTTINTNNIAQQNIINVHLTAYNNPNLKDAEKYYKEAVKKIFMAVPTLIEKIHFNENSPENHNLVIKNARTKLAKVFNGKKWTTMDEEKLLDELVDTYENLLKDYAMENSPKYITKMNIIKDRDTEEKVNEDLKTEVKKVLYDNRGIIKIK